MEQKSFYLDTCIWLNLFKKEGNPTKGVPYWEIARDFIEKVMFSKNEEIIYSSLIIREIKFKICNENILKEKLLFLKEEDKFRFVEVTEKDYSFARKLESELKYELSFYDCLHIAVCKRLNFILVTRDKDLIRIARRYIIVEKPENLFI
ncbi:MAG: PIN domain-containing protein [Nanoarchaeota archaeon]|nr:PIN domain-containing protein [Nanoarchaeota archaeon]